MNSVYAAKLKTFYTSPVTITRYGLLPTHLV